MENSLKYFVIVSLLLHTAVFVVFSLDPKRRANYVVLPVELMFAGAPAPAPAPAAPVVPPAKAPVVKPKDKDALAIPDKKMPLRKGVTKQTTKAPETKKPVEEAKPQANTNASGTGKGMEDTPRPGTNPNGVATQGPIALDTSFPYAYYLSTLSRNVYRSWQWSKGYTRLRSLVYFKISRDGKIYGVLLKESSGDSFFDEMAVRAIKVASFPPLPSGYDQEALGVTFEFKDY